MNKTKEIIQEAKQSFQDNLLDGDKVEDCGGAILSAEFVWEFLEETLLPEILKEYADWKIKECLPEKLPNDADNYKHTRDFTGYYDRGFNACIDQILSNKDKK